MAAAMGEAGDIRKGMEARGIRCSAVKVMCVLIEGV